MEPTGKPPAQQPTPSSPQAHEQQTPAAVAAIKKPRHCSLPDHNQYMADPLAHFLSIPWAAKLLTDPAVLDIWVSDRRPLASGEKQFVRSVLSSAATVRACVTFSLRVPASAEGKRAVSKSAALLRGGGPEDGEDPERRPFLLFSALLDMGDGLCGFKGTLHGGALAVLLDETMCSAADNQSQYVVTATMTTRFLKPVKVPGAVMVRARVVRKTGRKIWVRGTIEDGDGNLMAESEAMVVDKTPGRGSKL